ncbi:hypothetical protein LTR28_014062, partial [Elasticomyces elasticus]
QHEELLCQIKAVPGSPEEPNSSDDESYSDMGQGNDTIEEIVDGLRSRNRCLKDLGVSLKRLAQDAIVLEREEALESEGSREYAREKTLTYFQVVASTTLQPLTGILSETLDDIFAYKDWV